MAEPKQNELMEKIVSLCKRRGFIYQSSEIYGGINGFWDYGPLGAELKRNVKELWWHTMTRHRDDVVGLEATIIMAPQIWRASGHVDTFSDPMCDCLLTKKRFRADQIEPQSGTVYYYAGAVSEQVVAEFNAEVNRVREAASEGPAADYLREAAKSNPKELEVLKKEISQRGWDASDRLTAKLFESMSKEEFAVLLPPGKPPESAKKLAHQFYEQRGIKDSAVGLDRVEKVENSTRFNPENGALLTEPRPFNLMFKTYIGPTATEEDIAYLRPETAQAIFAQFKNVLDSSRVKVPFGIAQVGKAFRNEVTPRNFTFRSREFEQMELEFFIKPDEVIDAIHGSVLTVPAQMLAPAQWAVTSRRQLLRGATSRDRHYQSRA